MIFSRLFKKSYPHLDWIQVEISSICNGKCVYCPHTEYRTNWQNRLLPMELFQKITPAFARTKLVHLQGWGEPFTHPHFMDFLRLAKKEDCLVGTTTNGTMLDSEKIKEFVDEGLDIIGFSLVGIDEKNDSIRRGTRISEVLRCIDEIHRIRNSYSTDNPRIHIAYMLLRSGLNDMHKIPAFSVNSGISQTVISSLSLVVSSAMETESILASDKKECRKLMNDFYQIRKEAEDQGTEISFNIVSPLMEESYCSENIERALFVGSDGSVSPCVMAQIPVEGDNFHYFRGKRQPVRRLAFGNISDESLNTIWNKKEYKNFINSFIRDKTVPFCKDCLKHFILDLQEDSVHYQDPVGVFFP